MKLALLLTQLAPRNNSHQLYTSNIPNNGGHWPSKFPIENAWRCPLEAGDTYAAKKSLVLNLPNI
jgi:hypothetical protein